MAPVTPSRGHPVFRLRSETRAGHIFAVSSQCRKNASTTRTMPSSATLPSFSDPNVADCPAQAIGVITLAAGNAHSPSYARWRQDLSSTIAQCLNLEDEIHHTGSKLCILGLEPLKQFLIAGTLSIKTH
jgi:hypothetical protein